MKLQKLAVIAGMVGLSLLPSCGKNEPNQTREGYSLTPKTDKFWDMKRVTIHEEGSTKYLFLFDRDKDGIIDEMVRTEGYGNIALNELRGGYSCIVEHRVAPQFSEDPLFTSEIQKPLGEDYQTTLSNAIRLLGK